jgi:hypothetical protein
MMGSIVTALGSGRYVIVLLIGVNAMRLLWLVLNNATSR